VPHVARFVRLHRLPARLHGAAAVALACALLTASGSGTANAATLAGRLGSPSDFVPALRVHAWSRPDGRLYTVQTEPGQPTYALDVPAGRYVVFAVPADPGAPPVYGAHTRFSVCARDAQRLGSGACRDHSLVEVEVAKRRVDGADVTDWYLDDAGIAALDRALGREPEAVDEAQLAAPKFSEYPVPRLATVPRAEELQPADDDRLERDRAALSAALVGTPTFAGRFAIVRVPCTSGATGCAGAAILDLPLGTVTYPPALNPLPPAGPCTDRGVLQFRRDSRLLTLTARDGDQLVTRFYVWDGENGRLRTVAQLANTLRERCVAAPGTPTAAPSATPASAPPTPGAPPAVGAPPPRGAPTPPVRPTPR
jgi:hypothetical protein